MDIELEVLKDIAVRLLNAEREANPDLTIPRDFYRVFSPSVVIELLEEIDKLRTERQAFVEAANDLAGTNGWAWTAALAHVSGTSETL